MRSQQMLALITDYLEAVRTVEELMRRKLGQTDPLQAVRSGLLPKTGWLDKDEGIGYTFHGVGCLVESADFVVDFDYGPGGRIDGFDLWRLQEFLRRGQDNYPRLASENQQLAAFQNLEAEGIIYRSDELPSPHLYRLSGKSLP